jgi:Gamma-glutamyl cyclotransferase, AIG2-like
MAQQDGEGVVLPLKSRHITQDSYAALQPDTAPLPLFIYGCLLIPDNLYTATGFHTPVADLTPNTIAGILRGYRRHALRELPFPAIIPNANSDGFVAGALVLGLNKEERESVDGFEAGLYNLVEVDVEIQLVVGEELRTRIVRAETYV